MRVYAIQRLDVPGRPFDSHAEFVTVELTADFTLCYDRNSCGEESLRRLVQPIEEISWIEDALRGETPALRGALFELSDTQSKVRACSAGVYVARTAEDGSVYALLYGTGITDEDRRWIEALLAGSSSLEVEVILEALYGALDPRPADARGETRKTTHEAQTRGLSSGLAALALQVATVAIALGTLLLLYGTSAKVDELELSLAGHAAAVPCVSQNSAATPGPDDAAAEQATDMHKDATTVTTTTSIAVGAP